MPKNEASRSQRGFDGLEIVTPDQQINILRVSHRGFIDRCDPCRHSIPPDDGVGNTGGFQSRCSAIQALADFLHGSHHPVQDLFREVKLVHFKSPVYPSYIVAPSPCEP